MNEDPLEEQLESVELNLLQGIWSVQSQLEAVARTCQRLEQRLQLLEFAMSKASINE